MISNIKALILIIFYISSNAAIAADTNGRAIRQAVRASTDELDTLFDQTKTDARTPGLVYGVVANGELLHWRAYGVRISRPGSRSKGHALPHSVHDKNDDGAIGRGFAAQRTTLP